MNSTIHNSLQKIILDPYIVGSNPPDVSSRLIQVSKNGAITSYTYDSNGNRLTTPSGTQNYSYDAQDRIVSAGTKSYTFNTKGYLISMNDSSTGLSTTYDPDFFGNNAGLSRSDGLIMYFGYNNSNQRTSRYELHPDGSSLRKDLVYGAAQQPQAEIQPGAGGSQQTYQYLTNQQVPDTIYDIASGKSYRVIHDERGSVRLVIDGTTGAVVLKIIFKFP